MLGRIVPGGESPAPPRILQDVAATLRGERVGTVPPNAGVEDAAETPGRRLVNRPPPPPRRRA